MACFNDNSQQPSAANCFRKNTPSRMADGFLHANTMIVIKNKIGLSIATAVRDAFNMYYLLTFSTEPLAATEKGFLFQ